MSLFSLQRAFMRGATRAPDADAAFLDEKPRVNRRTDGVVVRIPFSRRKERALPLALLLSFDAVYIRRLRQERVQVALVYEDLR